MRILALFYLFLIYPTTSTSQTNADSVVHMTDISLKYLNSIFITHNVDSASSLWDKQVFLDITGGYMECDVSYQKKTKNEIIQKFKLDIIQFKGLDNQVKFKVQDAGLISMNDSDKFFFITFYIETFNPKDTILKYIALDFGSSDNGKTWKITRDHWAYYFVYYLCRREKRR